MEAIRLDELRRRYQQARDHKRDWNRKAQRLYELAMGLEPGQQVRIEVEEASTNYILLNLSLKVASLINSYRSAQIHFVGDDRAPLLSLWFNEYVKNEAVYEVEDILKDRFVTGLGIMGFVSDERVRIARIDPLTVYWSPHSLRRPSYVIRTVYQENGEKTLYEYWDKNMHIFFDEDSIISESPNPLGYIPYRFLLGFSLPNTDWPVGDVELVYPQHILLNEVRRNILEHARRGAGFFEVAEAEVDPTELSKLEEPGEPVIRTRSGNAIRPLPTPPLNGEWLQLEMIAKNDLDAQSGVSEYLRGSMPIANNIQFATQVLAALGAQNLRIRADWVPIQEALEWAALTWLRWAAYNGETRKLGDISIELAAIDTKQIGVRSEGGFEAVSQIGISPEMVAQAGLGRQR